MKLKNLLKEFLNDDEIIPDGEITSLKVTSKSNSISRTINLYSSYGECTLLLRALEGNNGIYTTIQGAAHQSNLHSFYLDLLEKVFKNNIDNMVHFTEGGKEHFINTKTISHQKSIIYGIYKGFPDQFANEIELIVKPFIDKNIIFSYQINSSFNNEKSKTITSKEYSSYLDDEIKTIYNNCGILKYMSELTLKEYPKLKEFMNYNLDSIPKVITTKSNMPEVIPIKGDVNLALKNLKDIIELLSFIRLSKAMVTMDIEELEKINNLKSPDDSSYWDQYLSNI